MVMYAGKQVEYGDASEVFYRPQHPYTWGLLDSLPRHDISEKGTLLPIDGQPPSLIDVPSGCAFHPRCPYVQDICRTDVPPLVDVEGGHLAACHFAGQPSFVRGNVSSAGEVA
jgi:oligopeptide transport system ATP-binding protein